jgi:hypothetical protein
MIYSGNLLKMKSLLNDQGKVEYFLNLNGETYEMSNLTGSKVTVKWLQQINCIHCGRKTNKSFAQGYCYPCFISLPQTDSCILHPETCRAHEGVSRDMEWSRNNCLTPHIVYLAMSPLLKVGVTRESQIPVRWIDQGADAAIPLARTPDRFTAGIIEVFLKDYLSDKTNWRLMLTGQVAETGQLTDEWEKAGKIATGRFAEYLIDIPVVTTLEYPVRDYPQKVKAVNLEKDLIYTGTLQGIRGQYWIFEGGYVINIRKYGGYLVNIGVNE